MGGPIRLQSTQLKMTNMVVSPREAEQLIHGIRILYGIDIVAVVERRTVCGLVGTNSNWIWKPALDTDDERRLFDLARITHAIGGQGLSCAGPVPDKNGRFITVPYPGAKPGYLQMWLPGRHVNVKNQPERAGAIHAIAQLHLFGRHPAFQMTSTLNRGKLLPKLKMKQKTLQNVWAKASERTAVLAPFESYVRETMGQCIFEYENWLRTHQLVDTFCHRDLAPHNLLWHQTEKKEVPVSVIDFDHSGFDDELHDVLQFVSHTIFLSDCTASDLEQMVSHYREQTGLAEDRLELLWRLLSWPDILIRTVVEWCRHGYEPDKEIRLKYAVMKEERRRKLLKETTFARRF
jgi:Ser/Thr protein kinase RdoA (MazF antagonist)